MQDKPESKKAAAKHLYFPHVKIYTNLMIINQ